MLYVYYICRVGKFKFISPSTSDDTGKLMMFLKGGFMKDKGSIVKLVFGYITEIWETIPIEEVGYPTKNFTRTSSKK